jgi:hypothetical protein
MSFHRRLLSLLLLLLSAAPALAQWPSTLTAFNDAARAVDSIGIAHRDGEYWFVAELWGPVATTGQVFVKRFVPGSGFGSRANISDDPGGADRLATVDRHSLPSLAIDSGVVTGTALNISMQRDAVGFGPTIENVAVNPVTLGLFLNPANLIDDDAGLTQDRGRSWISINSAMADAWSCWTYHAAAGDDDVYCRGRLTGQANLAWTAPILALATTAGVIEDHPSVTHQPSTARRVVAYHSATGIKVRLFDTAGVEDTPNNVSLGATTNVNFPHVVDAGGVLHVVAVNTATSELNYAFCSASCHDDASWTKETIDDITAAGDQVAHPQIAVDGAGHVFVAFQHLPAGLGLTAERVKVTARCATGGWDDDGGELVDDSQDREQIGGDSVFKALPAFVFDATDNRLSAAYVQAVNGADRIGRWARKDAGLAFADICAGQ